MSSPMKRQKGGEGTGAATGGDVLEAQGMKTYQSPLLEDGAGGANDDGGGKDVAANAAIPDSHMRSVLKGLTWRVVATSTTMIIAWFITGQVQLALEIGFIEVFAKILIYYVHERLWARVRV
jgi:uncharacterized membrane protein